MSLLSINKALIFIKKDFIIESSYKMSFILSLLTSVFPVISLFFVDKLLSGAQLQSLARYGGDYFSFALIGIAFVRYFQLSVETFSGSIKRAQMAGCLEAILSSRTTPESIVVMSSFYSFLSAGVQLILMFLTAIIFLGFDFSNTNIPALLLTLAISLVVFVSLGILSAAGTVIFKQGEPVGWLFGVVSGLLGGAMFPVSVMPEPLRVLSMLFPLTYALEALRLAILQDYSIFSLGKQLMVLAGMSAVLFPLSLQAFKWAVEKGKRDGSLMQY